jgi:hypothetical protein
MNRIALAAALLVPALSPAQSTTNPDTTIGRGQCYRSGSDALVACATTDLQGQDGQFGRDATAGLARGADGLLGFSFAKVCNSGAPAGTGTCPADPALGGAADDWGCTYDKVTGRTWEMKTHGGLRDADAKYTNYTPQYDPLGRYGSATDATGYVDRLNRTGLCGADDWVVEHIAIRQALVAFGRKAGGARVDPAWFPTLQAGPYWATSDHAPDLQHEWTLDFTDGSTTDADARDTPHYVHAVRRWVHDVAGSRWRMSPDGTDVTDVQANGLVWRRCVEGQAFDGSTCTGSPSRMTHEGALAHAMTQAGWRLPNIKELTWIVEREQFEPALDRAVWPGSPSEPYWSSTPEVRSPQLAWAIDFTRGAASAMPRASAHVLRLVHAAAP